MSRYFGTRLRVYENLRSYGLSMLCIYGTSVLVRLIICTGQECGSQQRALSSRGSIQTLARRCNSTGSVIGYESDLGEAIESVLARGESFFVAFATVSFFEFHFRKTSRELLCKKSCHLGRGKHQSTIGAKLVNSFSHRQSPNGSCAFTSGCLRNRVQYTR